MQTVSSYSVPIMYVLFCHLPFTGVNILPPFWILTQEWRTAVFRHIYQYHTCIFALIKSLQSVFVEIVWLSSFLMVSRLQARHLHGTASQAKGRVGRTLAIKGPVWLALGPENWWYSVWLARNPVHDLIRRWAGSDAHFYTASEKDSSLTRDVMG